MHPTKPVFTPCWASCCAAGTMCCPAGHICGTASLPPRIWDERLMKASWTTHIWYKCLLCCKMQTADGEQHDTKQMQASAIWSLM